MSQGLAMHRGEVVDEEIIERRNQSFERYVQREDERRNGGL
jgi:hypothetical protein